MKLGPGPTNTIQLGRLGMRWTQNYKLRNPTIMLHDTIVSASDFKNFMQATAICFSIHCHIKKYVLSSLADVKPAGISLNSTPR